MFLGECDGQAIRLTPWGEIAHTVWQHLDDVLSGITRDAFIVMPNHVHFIVWLCAEGAEEEASNRRVISASLPPPVQERVPLPAYRRDPGQSSTQLNEQPMADPIGRQGFSLGDVVRIYKALTTRQIRQAGLPAFAWQRNYYEHIIRDERELERIREYIASNPYRWLYDHEHPRPVGPVDPFPWEESRSSPPPQRRQ
ncbi:MAG: transposase [Thermomicrobium sp.]